MKKLISIISLCMIFLGLFSNVQAQDNTSDYFVVTAYYSPLPNQKYYMMGNLEAEKRLQGNGTNGASGKAVFSGMLAAPKKYDFGTKIHLEGIGVGVVEDRGGAIVRAGKRGYKYDRIDVWMGYGDEGLKRALAWGKRTVKGKIIREDTQVTFNYKNRPAPDWAVKGLQVKKEKTVFDYNVGKTSSSENIKKLQTLFTDIGIYKGKVDGQYNSEVVNIVYDFQVSNNIIHSKNDYGAGYWGAKTRSSFKKAYLDGYFDTEKKKLDTVADEIIKKMENKKELPKKIIFVSFYKTDAEISEVLKTMKQIGIYEGTTQKTYQEFIKIVYDFQLSNKIITKVSDPGAGFYGPKTRKKLQQLYEDHLKDDRIKKQEQEYEKIRQQELEKKYKEIEKLSINTVYKDIQSIGNLEYGETSKSVRELQIALKKLGYFSVKDTAYFGTITKKSIIQFQLDNNLIENKDSKYAGIVGDRTLETIGTELYKLYYKKNTLLASVEK